MLGGGKIPWKLWQTVSHVQNLIIGKHFTFSHIFCEANAVVNVLANMTSSSSCNLRCFAAQIPVYIRGLARLDQKHTPYIRMD